MALLFQKVASDLSTVRFDFNTLASASTGFGVVGNIDLGGLAGTELLGQPYDPGWQQVDVVRAPPIVSFRLQYIQSSTDNVVGNVQALLQELDVPSPYKIQLPGQSVALFFDGFRADLPSMLRAEGDLHFFIVNRLMDPGGLPIRVPRLAYLYQAAVTVGPTTVNNDPASGSHPRYITINASGTMPTKAQVKVAPSAGALVQARVARRGYGDLPAWRTFWFLQAESGSFTDAATVANDATASGAGSNAVDLLTANDTVYEKRIQWHITPSTVSAAEGTFRVYARMQGVASRTYQLGLVWSGGSVSSAVYANPVVSLKYPSAVSGWHMVDLGIIGLEHGLGTTYGYTLELWASADVATTFKCDYLNLWPSGPTPAVHADQAMTMSIRGWRDGITLGASPSNTYLGKALLGGATASFNPAGKTSGNGVSGNDFVLNANVNTDYAGVAPVGGIAYGSARLVITASITTVGVQFGGTFDLAVRNITDSSDLVQAGGVTQVLTTTYPTGTKAWTIVMTADTVGGKNYEVQVRSGGSPALGTITIHSIIVATRTGVGSGSELNANGDYGLASGRPATFLTASGTFSSMATQEGSYIDLLPGNQDLLFDWGDNPLIGYDAADSREPLAESVLARTADVTVVYYPRFAM